MRLGQALCLQKRYEEAIAEFDREKTFLEVSNHGLKDRTMIELHQKYVSTFVRMGRAEDARKSYVEVLTRFQNRLAIGADEPFSRYYVACAAAIMGDVDLALEHLKKAIEGRPVFNRARARVEPDFEKLRNDPQFQALLNS
jgi:tetratricopeptide (TPR) repeat protein